MRAACGGCSPRAVRRRGAGKPFKRERFQKQRPVVNDIARKTFGKLFAFTQCKLALVKREFCPRARCLAMH